VREGAVKVLALQQCHMLQKQVTCLDANP
jgi:hypothetical protein